MDVIMLFFFLLLPFFQHTLAMSSGMVNLIKFYTGFRKLCFCRCGVTYNQFQGTNNFHISGTEYFTPYELPWTAVINAKNTNFRGTLISDKHVITAASLLFELPASQVIVTLGVHQNCRKSNAMSVSVDAILIHPGYSEIVKNNDIALLRLKHAVQFSQFVSPICMPLYDVSDADHIAWATLWSKNDCFTRISTLPMISSSSCASSVSNSTLLTPDKGCLGLLGLKNVVCEEDIGGPVMTRWMPGSPYRLAGVIASASCDEKVTPLFTKTVEHLIWIYQNIRDDCQCF